MESTSFEDIKQIMREVAEMQKETARRFKETDLKFKETDRRFKETDLKFKELFKAQKETDRRFKETDLKFKELFKAQKETDRRFKETDLKFKELFKAQKETDRMSKELFEAQKETDLKFKETDRRFEETKQLVDKVCKQVGNVETNIGYAAETYFQTALANSLTFGNIPFDDVISNLKKERRGKSCEFDIVMVNHEAIAVIEVKHRIHPSLPEEMATRKAGQFRKFFPEYKNHRLYLGIAGLSMDKVVEENAWKFGVGLLKQNGDTIEAFDVPLKAY